MEETETWVTDLLVEQVIIDVESVYGRSFTNLTGPASLTAEQLVSVILKADQYPEIYPYIAWHPHCPHEWAVSVINSPDLYKVLSWQHYNDIIEALAENYHLPPETLEFLVEANEKKPSDIRLPVVSRVANNPQASSASLDRILTLIGGPSLPPPAWASYRALTGILTHPNTHETTGRGAVSLAIRELKLRPDADDYPYGLMGRQTEAIAETRQALHEILGTSRQSWVTPEDQSWLLVTACLK